MRFCLEGDFCSGKLDAWIDLVFGCKQRGRPAAEALNTFSDSVYCREPEQDWFKRKVQLLCWHECGACPTQLFTERHGGRKLSLKRVPAPSADDTIRESEPQIREGDYDFLNESEMQKIKRLF
jgi:hypothetical protein